MKNKKQIPRRIQRHFPKVTEVRDATESIVVSVEEQDVKTGKRKSPEQCALAKACVRKNIADAAMIGISAVWLIKGNTATRYKATVGVAREITSFDRHQDFAAGKDYVLGKISPTHRLDYRRRLKPSGKTASREPVIKRHKTINVRKLRTT